MAYVTYSTNLSPITNNIYVLSGDTGALSSGFTQLSSEVGPVDNSRIDQLSSGKMSILTPSDVGEIIIQSSIGDQEASGRQFSQVLSIESQSFDSLQQAQARTNIKAIGYDVVNPTQLTQPESREVCSGTNLESQFYNKRRLYNFAAASQSTSVNTSLANINRFAALSSLSVANTNGYGAIYHPKLTQSDNQIVKLHFPLITPSKFSTQTFMITREAASVSADIETLSTSFCGIELSLSGARIVQGNGQQSPTFTRSSFIDAQALGSTYILSINSNITLKSSTGQSQTLLNPQPGFQPSAIFFPLNIRNGTIGATEYSILLETDNSYIATP